MNKQINCVFVLLTVIAVLSSCATSENKAVGIRAIADFHDLYNKSAFSDIYESAHPNLKSMVPKENFVNSIAAMRQGQGAVLNFTEKAVGYELSSEGDLVKILIDVTFEKGKSQEEFIFQVTDGKAILWSYRFIPPVSG
jgi:hypothetical protein